MAELQPLRDVINDATATVLWGMEGTGKTIMVLKSWPLPLIILNFDRPLTMAHLSVLDDERIGQIQVLNVRETIKDLDNDEAKNIKKTTERVINENLAIIKGGTLLLDGGTLYRSVLRFADPKLAADAAAEKKSNPREKERVNAYIRGLVSNVQDQGVNLVVTAHAAWAWGMVASGEEGKATLQQTKNVYPQLDAPWFQATNLSLLLFKRCECGRNVVSQDGSCTAEGPLAAPTPGHQGRQHILRIVTNKFNTASEGTEWDKFDYDTLRKLCFDRERSALMLEAKRGKAKK
jgi:hypothetical protein